METLNLQKRTMHDGLIGRMWRRWTEQRLTQLQTYPTNMYATAQTETWSAVLCEQK